MPDTSTAAPDQEVGLRERQKRARRDALIDAAHDLVEAHGLENVSVEAICAEAGVSRRTFFNYFASKDDAILAIQPWEIDPTVARTFTEGGPTGRLGTDIEHLVRHLVDRPPLGRRRIARAIELARREPGLGGRQLAAFEEHRLQLMALATQRLDDESTTADVELLAMTIMTVTHGAFVRWETSDQQGEVAAHVGPVVANLREVLA
ncbi:helix-turn-helix domain-containing protein [Georgenia halophila]|uniref:TetR/AcrR family transcriptional regulator n=1 Tax=Georgenia halophila TaxID=620889 RepID=UPI0031EA69E2